MKLRLWFKMSVVYNNVHWSSFILIFGNVCTSSQLKTNLNDQEMNISRLYDLVLLNKYITIYKNRFNDNIYVNLLCYEMHCI